MTCEVAVMNKSAVALAADSAATLTIQPVHKIYMVNKLFALSEEHPIGIMIYGKPQLLGVPWETVIHGYQVKLGAKKFGTLKEYSDDLIGYIESPHVLFPESVQHDYLQDCLLICYNQICKDIIDEVKAYTEKKRITRVTIKKMIDRTVTKYCKLFKNRDRLPNVSTAWVAKLLTKYAATVAKIKKGVFKNLPISGAANSNLDTIGGQLFSRDVFREDCSGVVIAGFGNDEIFPHVKSFEIEGVVEGKAKYKKSEKEGKTGQDNAACIIPFAQEDMVRAFMEGLHPEYHAHVFRGPEYLLKELGRILPEIDEIKGLGEAKLKTIRSKLEDLKAGILDEYRETLTKYRQEEHIEPIMNAVSHLPKQELAAMAESLVKLVAFKRRMSVREVESVGGPIDVAVISKADGFVWVRRKRYFDDELNTHLSSSQY